MLTFEVMPILDRMLKLYEIPISEERFITYFKLLREDTKDNLKLPIQDFNPITKSHVLNMLKAL